jgi:hypothetical protein
MSKSIRRMTDHVRSLVASPENLHIQCVTPSKSGVVVWTDSGAWASRLRFVVPTLVGRLPRVDGFESVEQVTVKVAQPDDRPAPARRRIPLSMESAETLWSSAAHIADEDLAAALRRIASHATEK